MSTQELESQAFSWLHADELETKGFTMIPKPDNYDLQRLRVEFTNTLRTFLEFSKAQRDHVLGGFAALGNPASFHNPFVRMMREWQLNLAVKNVFRDNAYDGHRVETLFDRMMCRLPGKQRSAESWHRDESPAASERDLVFGGWTNLSSNNQFLS